MSPEDVMTVFKAFDNLDDILAELAELEEVCNKCGKFSFSCDKCEVLGLKTVLDFKINRIRNGGTKENEERE